jgi:hypothetical protein
MNGRSGTSCLRARYTSVGNKTVGVRFWSWVSVVVQVLPEELRARRAVGEGIGRGLRDLYESSASLPDHLEDLAARLERSNREANSSFSCARAF